MFLFWLIARAFFLSIFFFFVAFIWRFSFHFLEKQVGKSKDFSFDLLTLERQKKKKLKIEWRDSVLVLLLPLVFCFKHVK